MSTVSPTEQEGADWVATSLEGLNRVLVKHGLPPHDEPRELPTWQRRGECVSFPYSYLHMLRRTTRHLLRPVPLLPDCP